MEPIERAVFSFFLRCQPELFMALHAHKFGMEIRVDGIFREYEGQQACSSRVYGTIN